MAKYQAQLALDLQRESRFSASHFIPGGSNAAARHWLSRDAWPEGRLWIWGSAGTGKTHLLRAWAARHQALVVEADTLLCDEQGEIFAQGLPFHPIKGAVVLDHLDRLKNEVALLHILNRSQAEGVRVLMAARFPPARHHFALPDLASRLRATLTAVIDEPEDDLRATLILSLLAERQLVVAQPVTEWLWRHLPRTGEALVEAVKRLDAAALERGGPITRQLAQEVLSDMLSSASI